MKESIRKAKQAPQVINRANNSIRIINIKHVRQNKMYNIKMQLFFAICYLCRKEIQKEKYMETWQQFIRKLYELKQNFHFLLLNVIILQMSRHK